jgi:hypothetical protein
MVHFLQVFASKTSLGIGQRLCHLCNSLFFIQKMDGAWFFGGLDGDFSRAGLQIASDIGNSPCERASTAAGALPGAFVGIAGC